MIIPEFQDGYCMEPEGLHFECKECGTKFPQSFWETYSAFANTLGGTVALGLKEMTDGMVVIGVKDPAKVIKEMWDAVNDQEKVSINILTDDRVRGIDVDGCTVILIEVPRAPRTKRPVYINGSMDNGTFRRNGESDYHCTRDEINEMIRDAGSDAQDLVVVDRFTLDDLNQDDIEEYRQRMASVKPSSRWTRESRDRFLELIGAADAGEDGDLHPTMAGLLMFGMDYDIVRFLSVYKLDYQEYLGGKEWSKRIVSDTGEWSGNLFEFFFEICTRIDVKSPKPFELDGMIRVDDNDFIKAEREMVLNAIVHADYRMSGGVRIRLYPDRLEATNPGTFRIPIERAEAGGTSDPRNPALMKMFMLIGAVESSGQGLKRIIDTCSDLGIPAPAFTEEFDPARVIASMPMWNGVRGAETDGRARRVLELLSADGTMTARDLAADLDVSTSTVSRILSVLKEEGRIRREGGGTRGGRWKVL